ncbi:hypothetical protein [Peribacillus frigoritolerans]|uniref:hypothetical protein n=1 Tax=Peribacillus frigoritolerans TaxID=450367 RepID=UPI002E1C0357|nr:hypothetical protein [Peribacillus frigoritolerans]MED3845566.1 hypothetical protein [Peribacillus frigoritolerans]
MAKITVEGTVYEGTAEELKEIFEMMGVEFPAAVKADEVCEEVPQEATEEKPLNIGDYVKVVNERRSCFEQDDILKITDYDGEHFSGVRISDGFDHYVDSEGEVVHATDEEIAEAKAKVKRPKIGDVVVITGNKEFFSRGSVNNVGDVGKISREGDNGGSFGVEVPGNLTVSNCTHKSEVRLANAEEIRTYETAVSEVEKAEVEAKKTERWAKIGRKPNEFKKGDIVRVKEYVMGDGSGIEVVESGPRGDLSGGNYYFGDSATLGKHLELIAPVEAKFNA